MRRKRLLPLSETYFGLYPRHLSMIAGFLLLMFAMLFLALRFHITPLQWLIPNFVVVYLFFQAVMMRERAYFKFQSHILFEKRLFWQAFLVRIFALFLFVIIAQLTTGRSFYVGAVDSARYYRVAAGVADVFWNAGPQHIFAYLFEEYSAIDNHGPSLFIGLFFAFTFTNVIWGKIFIVFVGAWSVVFIYRVALLITDVPTARLAGWLAAFMPLSLFYDTVYLKESFVVFLTSYAVYASTRIIVTGGFNFWRVVRLILAVSAIFLFRAAAGAVIVTSLSVFFLVNNMRGNPVLAWLTGVIVIFSFIFMLNATGRVDDIITKIEGGAEHQADARIGQVERQTAWSDLALGPVFLVFSHFAPFPAMVNLSPPWGHDATYYWISGLIVWNILALFALLGIWRLIRENPRKSFMVNGYTVGLTIVLGLTAMFTSVRMGWTVIPMMMIPVAVGLRHYRKPFWFYLTFGIALMFILAWNLFRAIGRGVM